VTAYPACTQSGLLVLEESPPHIELLLPESASSDYTTLLTITLPSFCHHFLCEEAESVCCSFVTLLRGVPSSRLPNFATERLKSLRLRFGRESNTALSSSIEPPNIALLFEASCCSIAQTHRERTCLVLSEESATKIFLPSFVAIQLQFFTNLCRILSPSIRKRFQQVP
jgi:hypothetical protein